MDPIKVDFTGKGKGSGGKKAIVIPPEKAGLKLLISFIGTALVGAIAYYFMLPPLNFKAAELYYYIGIIIASFVVFLVLTSRAISKPEYTPYVKKAAIVPAILIGVLIVVALVGMLVSSIFFRAKSYSQIIDVNTNGQFEKDILEPDFKSIPKLDEDAAANLASRALSNLADLGYVSQFTVYPSYTQINYKEAPVRVATLQYANIIKWFTNRAGGFPGYIIIDMANENTEFVSLDEGMKYSPAEHFGRLLKRHLRFEYPTYMFADSTFEIDDSGTPFWICPRVDKTIGLFGGRDIVGAVFVNAVTGESKYYSVDQLKTDSSLQWVDRVYSSSLLVEQYNYYGRYQNGFWNSVLGQKNVFMTTEGYNYIAINDDVYLYTGVTSVTSDQSITGFVLINQRTKETIFYRVDGAKEQTAQSTAEGLVKDYGFKATFPLLLNISGEPTYFMALKDESNVVQRYAMINVKQYNKIKAFGSSLGECLKGYVDSLEANNVKVDNIDIPLEDADPNKPAIESKTVTGVIADIRTAVLGGESCYYIKLAEGDSYYSISASTAPEVVILNNGAKVTVTFASDQKVIIPATKIELAK